MGCWQLTVVEWYCALLRWCWMILWHLQRVSWYFEHKFPSCLNWFPNSLYDFPQAMGSRDAPVASWPRGSQASQAVSWSTPMQVPIAHVRFCWIKDMSDCFDVEQIKEAGKKMNPWKKKGHVWWKSWCSGSKFITLEVSRGSVLVVCHELSEDEAQPFGQFQWHAFGSSFTFDLPGEGNKIEFLSEHACTMTPKIAWFLLASKYDMTCVGQYYMCIWHHGITNKMTSKRILNLHNPQPECT